MVARSPSHPGGTAMTESPQRAPQRPTHRELLVQMQLNHGNATGGSSGTSVAASALMSVLVTLDGQGVSDLGANAGSQTSAISLPAGWTLRDGFNVRPGGCIATV